MKLTLAFCSLLALAAAQSSTSSSSASATTSLSPEASCMAAKCSASDTCCIAACYNVPCPSDQQANDTNTCVAACPQGNGTEAETNRYAACQNSCYSSHFFPATATGAGTSKTSTGSSATTTGSSKSTSTGKSSSGSSSSGSTQTGTSTASGSQASETANVASEQLRYGVSAAGLVGFALAAWAL